MSVKKKAVLHWSGGKDAALALQKVLATNEYEIISLLTTLQEQTISSSVHAIPLQILQQQAKSLRLPLYTIDVANDLSNYQTKMQEVVAYFKQLHVTHFIFGDLMASNIKTFREAVFNPLGIKVVQPLWHKTSAEILQEFLASGIKATIIVTLANSLSKNFIGKDLDELTIKTFPTTIDVCGEKGEYHTLVYAGDIFNEKIHFKITDVEKIDYTIKLASAQTTTISYYQAVITA